VTCDKCKRHVRVKSTGVYKGKTLCCNCKPNIIRTESDPVTMFPRKELKSYRERASERKEKHRQKLISEGKCTTCGCRKASETAQYCETCRLVNMVSRVATRLSKLERIAQNIFDMLDNYILNNEKLKGGNK